MKKHQLRNR